MLYNILKHWVLLFLSLRDIVPFESQSLEIRFRPPPPNVLEVFKPMYNVSYNILHIFQDK